MNGLSSRLTRWTLRLQEHDFEVEHKPGKDHGDADGVSRLVCDDEDITGPTSTDETTSDAIKEVRTILTDAVAHSVTTGGDPLLTQRHVAAAITTAVFGLDSDSSLSFGSSADNLNPTGVWRLRCCRRRPYRHPSSLFLRCSPGRRAVRVPQVKLP